VSGDTVSVVVTVQRDIDEDDEEEEKAGSAVGRVVCPRYGLEKQEAYWLVIGDKNSNALLSIKRISIGEKPTKVRRVLTPSRRL
jgi:pre-mRNA-splicing helicase BRR2